MLSNSFAADSAGGMRGHGVRGAPLGTRWLWEVGYSPLELKLYSDELNPCKMAFSHLSGSLVVGDWRCDVLILDRVTYVDVSLRGASEPISVFLRLLVFHH